MIYASDGTPIAHIRATWDAINDPDLQHYEVQEKRCSLSNWQVVAIVSNTASTEAKFIVQSGEGYEVRIRAVSVNQGGHSDFVESACFTAEGDTEPPPNVALVLVDEATRTIIDWQAVTATDLAGYKLRYHDGNNTDWASASSFFDGHITFKPFSVAADLDQKTVLVKSIDTSGNESADAASLYVTSDALGCPYEFGATDAQLVALFGDPNAQAGIITGPTEADFTINAVGGSQVTGQLQGGITSTPLPSGTLALPVAGTDIVALEVDITLPAMTAPLPVSAAVVASVGLVQPPVGSGYSILLLLDYATGMWGIVSPTLGLYTSLGTSGTFRLGMEINRNTEEVSVSYGGTTYTDSVSNIPTGDMIPTIAIQEINLTSAPDAGKAITIRIYQDAAEFTESHTAGAVALCDALVELP